MVHTPNSGNEKLLSVVNLRKAYRGKKEVIKGVDFDLYAGEMVAIVGQSGAGKSTLLHMLNGTVDSTSGHIIGFPQSDDPQYVEKLSGKGMREW